jgi:hypothetical protein
LTSQNELSTKSRSRIAVARVTKVAIAPVGKLGGKSSKLRGVMRKAIFIRHHKSMKIGSCGGFRILQAPSLLEFVDEGVPFAKPHGTNIFGELEEVSKPLLHVTLEVGTSSENFGKRHATFARSSGEHDFALGDEDIEFGSGTSEATELGRGVALGSED